MQHYLAVCTAISGYISHYTSFATMGSFWCDIMHKVPSHVLALYSKRQSDNSRVNKTFIHWPRWVLIKEWWVRLRSVFFFLSCTSACCLAAITGENRHAADFATIHCDYWFPQGVCLCFTASQKLHCIPPLYLTGKRCLPYWLLQVHIVNCSQSLHVFPFCYGTRFFVNSAQIVKDLYLDSYSF